MNENKKFCKYCHAEMGQNDKFCPNCGKEYTIKSESKVFNALKWFIAVIFMMIALPNIISHTRTSIFFLLAAFVCSPLYKRTGIFKNSPSTLAISSFILMFVFMILGVMSFTPYKKPQISEYTPPERKASSQITETATEETTTTTASENTTTIITETMTIETLTEPHTETPTPAPIEQAVTEPPVNNAVGKNVDELSLFQYYGDVRNDVTGKWRYAVCADSGKNIAEYAVSYYNKYMSEGEIHAIINFSDRTTTKIVQAIDPDKIALTVYEYVDGEEHDAKLMFGGNVIAYYMVNKNTGEITEE